LDDVVGQFIAGVENAMANGQEDTIAAELRALHIHVSDTYRLHQRLIRTRRRDLPGWVLPPRTALLDDLLEDDDERTPLLVDALDQWRQRSLEDLEMAHGGADETFELNMANRYARLHEALGMSVEACAKELQLQLDNVRAGQEPSFEGDQETLEFALVQTRGDTEETRASFAAQVVQGALKEIDKIARRPRIVVFGSSTELVLDVATQVESEQMAEVFESSELPGMKTSLKQ
jgi:ATP-dependent helicase HepA